MKTALLDYDLPDELIASRPPERRDGGRMLAVRRDTVEHLQVADFAEQLNSGDLLVLNETKVRKARIYCQRPATTGGGGGRVELLFLHSLGGARWAALGRANRPLRPGSVLLGPGIEVTVVERDELGTLHVDVAGDLEAALERSGMMPIPPYMERDADAADDERYQTVFAEQLGSAAAPTAGLHLTERTLERARARGVEIAHVVLHVGIGTFRPVTADDLDEHPMHSEEISVSPETAAQIAKTKARGGRVVAVGTTVVRTLESAADPALIGQVLPTQRATNLLIQPGYQFRVVDALLTNFHQPKSTLLALVAAFAGYERMRSAYQCAVEQRYRFLSYGDAMWIPGAWGNGISS